MSNELKCPFCQQGLQPISIFDNRDKRCVWYCPNCATNKGLWVMANELVWQELIRTRKTLEQSEICCTEWEKQALDYKAENIALSGDLERTHKALDVAVDALKGIKNGREPICLGTGMDINDALEQITALEQKEHFADASKMINKRM